MSALTLRYKIGSFIYWNTLKASRQHLRNASIKENTLGEYLFRCPKKHYGKSLVKPSRFRQEQARIEKTQEKAADLFECPTKKWARVNSCDRSFIKQRWFNYDFCLDQYPIHI